MSYAKRANFRAHFWSPWTKRVRPDVVLVDGRFRLACFFTSLLKARSGASVIFDDYSDRPEYHIAEEFIKPAERFGRQARFVVPDVLPREAIASLLDKFEYVMD